MPRKELKRLIASPNNKLSYIELVAKRMGPGDIIQVEIRNEAYAQAIAGQMERVFPERRYQVETFASNGKLWAYVYYEQPNKKRRVCDE